jgi:hypothetical protein
MKTKLVVVAVSLTVACLAGGHARAQDKPAPPSQPEANPPRLLERSYRVRLVAHRLLGAKRIGSVPYEFVAKEGSQSTLRVGTEVPVPVTTFTALSEKSGAGAFSPATSFQYKVVGVSVDLILGRGLASGHAQVRLQMEHSVIGPRSDVGGNLSAPQFLTSNAKVELMMRPGEAYQVASTPLAGGEESLLWELELTPIK